MNPAELTTLRNQNILLSSENGTPKFKKLNQLDTTIRGSYHTRALSDSEPQSLFVYTASHASDEYGFEKLVLVGGIRPVSGSDKRLRVLAKWKGAIHLFVVEHGTISSVSPAWIQLIQDYEAATSGKRLRVYNQKFERVSERVLADLLVRRVYASG